MINATNIIDIDDTIKQDTPVIIIKQETQTLALPLIPDVKFTSSALSGTWIDLAGVKPNTAAIAIKHNDKTYALPVEAWKGYTNVIPPSNTLWRRTEDGTWNSVDGNGNRWEVVTGNRFGDHSYFAIDENGHLWSWGLNKYGQLGLGYADLSYHSPTQINTKTWSKVSSGFGYVLAIDTDGELWSWGRNNMGQLGSGGTTERYSPGKVNTPEDGFISWRDIEAGYDHCFGWGEIFNVGTPVSKIFGWGRNCHGLDVSVTIPSGSYAFNTEGYYIPSPYFIYPRWSLNMEDVPDGASVYYRWQSSSYNGWRNLSSGKKQTVGSVYGEVYYYDEGTFIEPSYVLFDERDVYSKLWTRDGVQGYDKYLAGDEVFFGVKGDKIYRLGFGGDDTLYNTVLGDVQINSVSNELFTYGYYDSVGDLHGGHLLKLGINDTTELSNFPVKSCSNDGIYAIVGTTRS